MSACNDSDTNDIDTLFENRAKWEALNESRYEMDNQHSAFSPDSGSYRVYVEQERVQTALRQVSNGQDDFKSPDHFIFDQATVANLFVIAEQAIAMAEDYEIAYHPEFGYPTLIRVDVSRSVADDEALHTVSDMRLGSQSICLAVVIPAISVNLSLAGNPDANVCDATVTLEDGDYTEQLESCSNNRFRGADERAGTYTITASYPGYNTQSINGISAYRFICNVQTVNVDIQLAQSQG
ncbi:DUF6174 domain-containing protein [Glaciecola sp. SC05]|uniref:DUF6174 domain-containing protein n=1 Tax=Glaciecola sp. SC05 TaxID=1987355 RepID=UPI0035292EC8